MGSVEENGSIAFLNMTGRRGLERRKGENDEVSLGHLQESFGMRYKCLKEKKVRAAEAASFGGR